MAITADKDPNLATRIQSSIRITADGLCFYTRTPSDDPEQNAVLSSTYYKYEDGDFDKTTALKNIFFREKNLSMPFAATHLFIEPSEALVMPRELLSDGQQDLGMNFCQRTSKQVLQKQSLHGLSGIDLFFHLPEDMMLFAQRSFSMPSFKHPLSVLIPKSVKASLQSSRKQLYVLCGHGLLSVALSCQGDLLLANSWETPDLDASKYHFTHVWRSMGLQAEHDALCLYADSATELEQYLRPRIQDMTVYDAPKDLADLFLSLHDALR